MAAASRAGYTPAQRSLQDECDTRRIADRIDDLLVRNVIGPDAAAFIEQQDMMFVASVDGTGCPTCSYKGGAPGFVRVLDEHTLAYPSYDGNGMFLTLGNVTDTHQIGLLFIDFEHPNRLRIHGRASVSDDDPLVGTWPGAQHVVRVEVTAVFPNCPRYIHRMQRTGRSPFVPDGHQPPPVPEWKRMPWAADVLPANDPARAQQ